MQVYAKAIAAVVTPLILTLLVPMGIGADTPLSDVIYLLVTALLTGAAVLLIPNKPK